VGGLAELADELQRCVHEYSEELVSELARRDELDFEKELKNQFIWLLLRVQRRRRQLAQLESRAAATGLHKASTGNAEVTAAVSFQSIIFFLGGGVEICFVKLKKRARFESDIINCTSIQGAEIAQELP